jgi:3-deoxy-D-manno-octulosonate 8-phosphate phosphatase (KDO 8-P phosphatase)
VARTKLDDRCQPIELILCDVDGALTDGSIVYDNQGIETKSFHVRDGLGIRLWQRGGYRFGVLTSRSSHIVKVRCAELGVDLVRQGFEDKLPAAQEVIKRLDLEPAKVCYIGDDLPDLPVMRHVGLAVAVADAVEEVLAAAHFTTNLPGGQGAVRELIEMLLKVKLRWDDLIRGYLTP